MLYKPIITPTIAVTLYVAMLILGILNVIMVKNTGVIKQNAKLEPLYSKCID